MNRQEIQSKIEELENELSKLKEELNKPENKAFYPKNKQAYYFIYDNGDIVCSVWNNDMIDCTRYALGNCFETREETEFAVERLKVIVELKRFAENHNEPIDWNDRIIVHYIAYDYLEKKVSICFTVDDKSNDIYFSSNEIVQQAIETIGEERIKKYYLGVEDYE